jgi:hypothetical protein
MAASAKADLLLYCRRAWRESEFSGSRVLPALRDPFFVISFPRYDVMEPATFGGISVL